MRRIYNYNKKFYRSIFPYILSVLGTVVVPFTTLGAYSITHSTNKYKKQIQTLVENEKLNAKIMAEDTIKKITGQDVDLGILPTNNDQNNLNTL